MVSTGKTLVRVGAVPEDSWSAHECAGLGYFSTKSGVVANRAEIWSTTDASDSGRVRARERFMQREEFPQEFLLLSAGLQFEP